MSSPASPLDASRPSSGERKTVTVLFADVVGSTAMAEQLDPEEVVEIMNGAFAAMNAAVDRYQGEIARLMGDAVLAFFGAPTAHEDDPERAVRAALEIRDAAQQYAQSVEQRYGVEFGVRIGINTGLVVAGQVGSALRQEYTAMGDTPNVAARLQAAAAAGTILVSDSTYRLVRHLVEVAPRGELAVKGKSQPVETYEVLRLKPRPGKARGLEGIHSPLVGRDTELRLLQGKVEALRQRQGGFVALLGEAGLGKSRLVAEVREQTASDQVRWLEGRALSYGQSLVYYPWRQVLREALEVRETASPAEVRAKLAEGSCTCCRQPGGDLPFLETILAVESEESLQALTGVEGDDFSERIADAVQGYLCMLARHQPVVVVFDDMHWADPASLELLVRMAEVVEQHPLLLFCVLRPEKEAPSWAILQEVRGTLVESYTEIALEPLDPQRSRELLGNLLHIEDLPDSMRTLILRKSEGNPFFLEEVLRSLIDSGHVVQENGHWRATGDIVNVTIPDTLAGVLTARIDRLAEEPKRVVQTASVLGRIFAHRVLTDVCTHDRSPEPIEDVNPHIDKLTEEELVRERARTPELEYIFKHALTQEAAYELLLVRRRKELHRRAGEALERLYQEKGEEVIPMLARHFMLGEEWERAAEYSVRAGARAVKVYALREGLEHYQSAVEALERIPEAPPTQSIDAILAWTDVAVKLRLHEALATRQLILERLDRAEQLVRRLADERRLAQVLVAKGNVLTQAGLSGDAFPLLAEASALATELGDEGLFLLPYFEATEAMVDRDPRRAAEQLEHVIELARKHRDKGIEAHALALKAQANARLGEFRQARQVIEEALALAPHTNSAIREADVYIAAGAVYSEMGDMQRGLELSRYGAEKSLAVNNFECACAGYAITGYGNLLAERPDDAVQAYGEALRLSKETSSMDTFLNQVYAGSALAQQATGDPVALAELEQRLENARKVGDDYGSAFLSRALGQIFMQQGELERAEQQLEAALSYYRQHRMRPYLVRTLQSLAQLQEQQGRTTDAENTRAEAEALMQELQPFPTTPAAGGQVTPAAS